MKKSLLILFLMTISVMPGYSSDYDIEQDGVGYSIHNLNFKTLTLEYCPVTWTGEFIVPSQIEYNGTAFTVDKIGNTAFNNCASITSLIIPGSIESFGLDPFIKCYGLKELIIEESEESIMCGSYTLKRSLFYDSPLEYVYLGRRIRLTNSNLSSSVNGFNGVKTLKKITIGKNVSLLDPKAFEGCVSLTTVIIEDGENGINIREQVDTSSSSKIGQGAFYGCPLEYVYVGRSVVSAQASQAGYGAFALIPELKTVIIGSLVSSLGTDFYGSENINTVNSYAIVPPTAKQGLMDNKVYLNAKLTVPEESLILYQNTSPWKNFLLISGEEAKIEKIKDEDLNIYVEDGQVKIAGKNDYLPIEIYSLSGLKIYGGIIKNSPSLKNGFYFIQLTNRSFKILIK